jgi:DNA repair protein RecN (Recombination protein N)
MLKHLRVTNFSILSDVTVEFGEGLNVLTGETGAGKSLIVEAVNLLRGGRASADIPRTGTDEAVVEALVEVPADLLPRVRQILVDAGLPALGDDDLLVRRVIQRGGRSRTYINGSLTTVGRLGEVGALLIDLSGQHEHQGLVDPNRHRDVLDAFARAQGKGHAQHGELLAQMTAGWARLGDLDAQLAALDGDERAREARCEFLRYQLDELDAASPVPGEDRALEAERLRLAGVDQLQLAARSGEELIYAGDDSARDRLAAAARELDRMVKLDPSMAAVAAQLAEARALVDDLAAELRQYAERLDADPQRLSAVEDRLALLRALMRKHGGSLDELATRATELRAELDALLDRDSRLAELTAEQAAVHRQCRELAERLHAVRVRAALKLEADTAGALEKLGMSSSCLSVQITSQPLGPTGGDRVELLLGANKGEKPRPLAKIASGGELSRITLALKLALRRADEVATYVFDEVDAGIGGLTANAVGQQIAAVAAQRQVLCVTHLPQIAAFGDHHFSVTKHEEKGRTETSVTRLSGPARQEELARMLGGQRSAAASAHAAELLEKSRKRRRPGRREAGSGRAST